MRCSLRAQQASRQSRHISSTRNGNQNQKSAGEAPQLTSNKKKRPPSGIRSAVCFRAVDIFAQRLASAIATEKSSLGLPAKTIFILQTVRQGNQPLRALPAVAEHSVREVLRSPVPFVGPCRAGQCTLDPAPLSTPPFGFQRAGDAEDHLIVGIVEGEARPQRLLAEIIEAADGADYADRRRGLRRWQRAARRPCPHHRNPDTENIEADEQETEKGRCVNCCHMRTPEPAFVEGPVFLEGPQISLITSTRPRSKRAPPCFKSGK